MNTNINVNVKTVLAKSRAVITIAAVAVVGLIGIVYAAHAQTPPPPPPAQTTPAAAKALGIVVESVVGPRQVHPGQEFTLVAKTSGEARVTGYLWRLRMGETTIERKTDKMELTATLDSLGEWFATFEVHGSTGMLAARTIKFSVTPPPPAAAPAQRVLISRMAGPKQAFAGQEFTLSGEVNGLDSAAAVSYVWRFAFGGEAIEKRTDAPQVKTALDKVGDYAVTCNVVDGKNQTLASQKMDIKIIHSQVAVKAGGPYNAMLNKPVKVLGNARTNTGKIVKYEWFFTESGKPEWSSAENGPAEHVYATSGTFGAIFKVTLADGAVGVDTAVVNVGSLLPTADAGGAVVSSPNKKVKLSGKGRSPDGAIAKYEWDFDGDGNYDWSSDKSGEAVHPFKVYSYPVLRVTDTEGNSATDTARVVICPATMVTVTRGKYCIDKYEWPNKRGEMPTANMTWHEAAKACESAGKRLCSADEWQRACRGDRSANEAGAGVFPYGGRIYDISKCNTIGNPKVKNKLAKSGAFGACVGEIGAFDMSGNAAEWTAVPDGPNAPAFGGFYQSDHGASNCDASVRLEKERKYLYAGFRCCK